MIAAIILAAGQSKRMGKPKMTLPWGKTTVLGQVITTLHGAGIDRLVVVTGGAREEVESLVAQLRAEKSWTPSSLSAIHNEQHASGEMLSSVQTGLAAITADAALITPGDQPLFREESARQIIGEYNRRAATILVPSYRMRRGHPWLIRREHWEEILLMKPPETLRDFLNRHTKEIHYVEVHDPGILQDLDTPEDYLKTKP